MKLLIRKGEAPSLRIFPELTKAMFGEKTFTKTKRNDCRCNVHSDGNRLCCDHHHRRQ
jgi:hypothetical protein